MCILTKWRVHASDLNPGSVTFVGYGVWNMVDWNNATWMVRGLGDPICIILRCRTNEKGIQNIDFERNSDMYYDYLFSSLSVFP